MFFRSKSKNKVFQTLCLAAVFRSPKKCTCGQRWLTWTAPYVHRAPCPPGGLGGGKIVSTSIHVHVTGGRHVEPRPPANSGSNSNYAVAEARRIVYQAMWLTWTKQTHIGW